MKGTNVGETGPVPRRPRLAFSENRGLTYITPRVKTNVVMCIA